MVLVSASIDTRVLQRKCFDAPLQLQELEGIKDIVRDHTPSGVRDGGITEAGFLYLQTMFIQRGRLETPWTVLRKFGYAEDLKLTEAFLGPKYDFHSSRGCFV
jgi:Ras family protein T1